MTINLKTVKRIIAYLCDDEFNLTPIYLVEKAPVRRKKRILGRRSRPEPPVPDNPDPRRPRKSRRGPRRKGFKEMMGDRRRKG